MRRQAVAALLIGGLVLAGVPATAAEPPTFVGTVTRVSGGADPAYDSKVAVAPDGTATAVWTVGPPGGPYTITTATRALRGTWSAAEPVGPVVIDDAEPHVAVDAAGNVTVAWRDVVGSTHYFKSATRAPGSGWSAPYDVSTSPDSSGLFDLAVGAEGTAVMTWLSGSGMSKKIMAARRLHGTWGAPVNLSGATVPADHPAATIDATGKATVVWVSESGAGEVVRTATRPLGEAWGPPTVVGSVSSAIDAPAIATAADGSTWVVRTQLEGLGFALLLSRRPTVGGWSEVTTVHDLLGPALDADLTAGEDGTLALVWRGYVYGLDEATSALVRAPDGTLTPVAVLSASFDQVESVHAAVGPDGAVTAIWDGLRGAGRPVETATRPPGGAWGAVRTLDPSGGGDSSVGVDSLGNGVATWDSSGLTSVIHVLSTVLDAGSPGIAVPTMPTVGYAGRPLSFAVAPPTDAASAVTTTWTFGDGTQATGTSVAHVFTGPATYHVLVTATDEAGHAAVRAADVLVHGRPELTRVSLQRHRIVRHGPSRLKKVRLAFTLGAPGRVVVKVAKKRKPARAELVLDGLSRGRHTVVLRTRIGGVRLKPGAYRVRLVATNPAGKAPPKVVRLRVLPHSG